MVIENLFKNRVCDDKKRRNQLIRKENIGDQHSHKFAFFCKTWANNYCVFRLQVLIVSSSIEEIWSGRRLRYVQSDCSARPLILLYRQRRRRRPPWSLIHVGRWWWRQQLQLLQQKWSRRLADRHQTMVLQIDSSSSSDWRSSASATGEWWRDCSCSGGCCWRPTML